MLRHENSSTASLGAIIVVDMPAAPALRLTPEQRMALDSRTAAARCSTVAGRSLRVSLPHQCRNEARGSR